MLKTVRPEDVGISSANVLKYLKMLDDRGLATHSVLLARGDNLFTECYWEPFDQDTQHRMYSTTKSYVGIAVAQLIAEGKLSLDDKIVDFFPECQPKEIHPWFKEQTIGNMLTMQTCVTNHFWLGDYPENRVQHYFELVPCRPAGTAFYYDSEGSFVLGALVEKVTGMKLLDYLRSRCLDEIGFSKEAHCLTAPGGYSWGDSALICTSRDQLLFGRLLAKKGEWNGKQLLDRNAVETACSKLVDNYGDDGLAVHTYDNTGYGYQIWRIHGRAFGFCGMHCQYMVHDPETDITFVCTSSNPVSPANQLIMEGLFHHIIEQADTTVGTEADQQALDAYIASRKLHFLEGQKFSSREAELEGKKFIAQENPMGIKEFSFRFTEDSIIWCYENETGYKELAFGRCRNNFCQFPETDMAKEIGNVPCPGHTYKCAISAAWKNDDRMSLKVQIIDEYLGAMNMTVSFREKDAFITMFKHCEGFMNNYKGTLTADAAK